MTELTSAEQVQACVNLIADPENIAKSVAMGAWLITGTVFVFIKKSMPDILKQIGAGVVNFFGKKK